MEDEVTKFLTKKVTNADKVAALKTKSIRQLLEDGTLRLNEVGHAEKAAAHLREDYCHGHLRGVWLWGAAGAGKTWKALHNYGTSTYKKSTDKWWQHYAGEKVVVMDDIPYRDTLREQEDMAYHLTQWCQEEAAIGEVKGSSTKLQHHLFIVTANYDIDTYFNVLKNKTPERLVAIKRRFIEISEFKQEDVASFDEIKAKFPQSVHECECVRCKHERSNPPAPAPVDDDDELLVPESPLPTPPIHQNFSPNYFVYSQSDEPEYCSQAPSPWSSLAPTQYIDLTQDD